MTERAVPILLSRNLRETLAFYEALNFENRGAPPEEWDYLILGRGEIELHFSLELSVDPFSSSIMCFLFVDDAAALYEQWRDCVPADPSTGSRIEPPMATDYGITEFAVVDPNGNLLRIGTPVEQPTSE